MNGALPYEGTQRLRTGWVWACVLAIALGSWAAFAQQIVRGRPVGTNPVADWGMVLIWIIAGIGLPWLIASVRLTTRIDADGLDVVLLPFARRRIRLDEIASHSARTYSPIREYGGWGVRGSGSNRAYTLGGNEGVQLTLRNGDRVLIGSDHAAELASALSDARARL